MYEDILIPTDGSEMALAVVEDIAELAREFDATVHGLYVVDTRISPVERTVRAVEESGESDAFESDHPVAVLGRTVRSAGVAYTGDFREGVPQKRIVDYADERGIDLVAMATHGRTGVYRHLAGSTTEAVVRHSDVPVLTVPVTSSSP